VNRGLGNRTAVIGGEADAETIEALLAAGASAYCTKDATPGDLAAAVRQSFDRSVYFVGAERVFTRRLRSSPSGLTKREREILALVADGHSNAEVARMLFVTEQTVKFHLSNVYRKLGVANRVQASRWARMYGLLPERRPTPPPQLSPQGA
jgi:NarL family two-component system response regulator LiaR